MSPVDELVKQNMTDEDVKKVIADTYKSAATQDSVYGIFLCRRALNPNLTPFQAWHDTLNHILSIYEGK